MGLDTEYTGIADLTHLVFTVSLQEAKRWSYYTVRLRLLIRYGHQFVRISP